MKLSCNVISDLLPLYAEHIASKDSKLIVEEHLEACEVCRKYLRELKSPDSYIEKTEELPMKKLKSLLVRKKIQVAAISVLVCFLAAVIISANLVAPRYFPYSKDIIALKESAEGTIYASFSSQVTGYGISSCLSDDNSGYAYHIVAWDSIWDGDFGKNDTKNVVLNPNGEPVKAVYYYETNGSGEKLLYGEQQNPCGIIIKQPNLSLLAACAALMLLVCTILLAVFRKHKNVTVMLTFAILLPLSYLLSHLLVKGFSAASYSSSQSFWEILLFMLPIYCVLLSFILVLKRSLFKNKTGR